MTDRYLFVHKHVRLPSSMLHETYWRRQTCTSNFVYFCHKYLEPSQVTIFATFKNHYFVVISFISFEFHRRSPQQVVLPKNCDGTGLEIMCGLKLYIISNVFWPVEPDSDFQKIGAFYWRTSNLAPSWFPISMEDNHLPPPQALF